MKKFKNFMSGKGYYIALVLCAVAIGISGYLYYRNADKKPVEKDVPAVNEQETQGQEMPVVGTQPGLEDEQADATLPLTSLPVSTKPMQTVWPLEGEAVAVFAMDHLTYNPTTRDWRVHNGLDIAAEPGTAVCAAAAGTVYNVYADETMGTTVIIRHDDGYVTCYASLDEETAVEAGQAVSAGQKIGTVGSTALLESAIGEHVHFSVTHDLVPVDPAEFLKQE